MVKSTRSNNILLLLFLLGKENTRMKTFIKFKFNKSEGQMNYHEYKKTEHVMIKKRNIILQHTKINNLDTSLNMQLKLYRIFGMDILTYFDL